MPRAGGSASCQEAPEGDGCSAEAPANLDPEYDEPRTSGALELGVVLAPFAFGCLLHSGYGAGIRGRPRGAGSDDRADDRCVDRELDALPQRHAVGEFLNATRITDRHIDVHVANLNVRATCAPASRQT